MTRPPWTPVLPVDTEILRVLDLSPSPQRTATIRERLFADHSVTYVQGRLSALFTHGYAQHANCRDRGQDILWELTDSGRTYVKELSTG